MDTFNINQSLTPDMLARVFASLRPNMIEIARQVCKHWQQAIGNNIFLSDYIMSWCRRTRTSVSTLTITTHCQEFPAKTHLSDCVAYMRAVDCSFTNREWVSVSERQQEGPTHLYILKSVIAYISTGTSGIGNKYVKPGFIYTYDYEIDDPDDTIQNTCTDGCVSLYLHNNLGSSIYFAEHDWIITNSTFTSWHYWIERRGMPTGVPPIKWLLYGKIGHNVIAVISAFNNIAKVYTIPWPNNITKRHSDTLLIASLNFNNATTHIIKITGICIAVIYDPTADSYPREPLAPAKMLAHLL